MRNVQSYPECSDVLLKVVCCYGVCCTCRHNGKAQGYEPWNRGFNESWLPDDYVHVDNLMRCVDTFIISQLS
jgi:hypothetical protein